MDNDDFTAQEQRLKEKQVLFPLQHPVSFPHSLASCQS
jgi:hypothetical protein